MFPKLSVTVPAKRLHFGWAAVRLVSAAAFCNVLPSAAMAQGVSLETFQIAKPRWQLVKSPHSKEPALDPLAFRTAHLYVDLANIHPDDGDGIWLAAFVRTVLDKPGDVSDGKRDLAYNYRDEKWAVNCVAAGYNVLEHRYMSGATGRGKQVYVDFNGRKDDEHWNSEDMRSPTGGWDEATFRTICANAPGGARPVVLPTPIDKVQLFGIVLEGASRQEVRQALSRAGVKPTR